MRRNNKRGFTLIELLVVIAIIAVLAVVVILSLNPAELLKQARDSSRISDLSTLKTAISLYLVDATTPNIASSSFGFGSCYLSTPSNTGTTTAKCGVFTNTYTSNASVSAATYRNNNSTGWIPVNFSQLSYGSPLGTLPVDPSNNTNYYYAYAATTTGVSTFEIDAIIESRKYAASGTSDVVSTDGGNNVGALEIGIQSGLTL